MSVYTTQVRFICEEACGLEKSAGFNIVNEIIEEAIPKVFDFDFPIFDEEYRKVLCGKILKHFYTREICCETVGRWKLFLDEKLNLVMPYYNKLYESARLNFNPIHDVDYTTTHQGQGTNINSSTNTNLNNTTSNGNESRNSTNNSHSKDRYSDTPQGGLDGMESIENDMYLTNARLIDGNGTNNDSIHREGTTGSDTRGSATFDGRTTDDYVTHVVGKMGGVSYSKMIIEYRKALINIDAMIIKECDDLFMSIW